MRVLIINRHIPPEFSSSLITVMEGMSGALARSGHQVSYLGWTHEPQRKTNYVRGGFTYSRWTFFMDPKKGSLRSNLQGIRDTYREYKKLRAVDPPDMINLHESRLPWRILRETRKSNTPVLYTFHASVAWEYRFDFRREMEMAVRDAAGFLRRWKLRARFWPNYWWLRYHEKNALKKSDRVLVASRFVAGQVQRLYGRRFARTITPKIVILPFGGDYQKFQPKISATRREGDTIQIVRLFCLRRLTWRMGLEDLVAAAGIIRRENPELNFQLTIGGKGPLAGLLAEQIRELGLDEVVRLAGFIPDEELPAFYRSQDIFVLPTRELEGFGLVLLEAMASGLPVVGSDAGAIPEVLEGAPLSYSFRGGYVPDLAHKLTQSITDYQATRRAGGTDQLKENLANFVREKYNWDNYGRALVELARDWAQSKKK